MVELLPSTNSTSSLDTNLGASAAQQRAYPEDVGIVAMEAYYPQLCVDQAALEAFDGVSAGKYTIGLGQTKMAFCSDREDINSICLTVVDALLQKYNVQPMDIGRLEVGTETIIDKSKSVKSALMQLFQASGNTNIDGIDTTNACYGGTSALFNAINWIESSSWDGRYAVVVAGDIAVYASGSARPTGGVGVVAMLIGPNAPVIFERGLRATHMEHVYDFYKPNLSSEFPEVDGPLTIVCYLRALDMCYARYLDRLEQKESSHGPAGLHSFDYLCFHSPYTKLVQKSFGRLAFNDFLRHPEMADGMEQGSLNLNKFKELKLSDTYTSKEVEKTFVELSRSQFQQKTAPSLHVAKNVGNSYCGSLYGGLVSLICESEPEELLGKRIGLFSYGSGLASSLFSVRVVGSTQQMRQTLDIRRRLDQRTVVTPSEFVDTMNLREETHNLKQYSPVGNVDMLAAGTFYLTHVDEKFRRQYAQKA